MRREGREQAAVGRTEEVPEREREGGRERGQPLSHCPWVPSHSGTRGAGMQSLMSARTEYRGVDVRGGVSLFTGERPWEWGRGLPLGIKKWALFL